MRIVRIDAARVGRWAPTTLTFEPGLNVVFGPNEAGKSTALRAVEALLFAVPADELKLLLAPRSVAQFDATVHLERDGALGLERIAFRRAGRALVDEANRPLLPETQHAWLWETSRQDFRSIYALGHQDLRDQRNLLGKGNTLGRVLAEIAAAGRDVAGVSARFQADLDKRYRPRGGARFTLTSALGKVRDATDLIKAADTTRGHSAYRAATDTRARADETLVAMDEKLAALRADASDLDRLLFAPPALAEIAELTRLRRHLSADGPVPSPAWAERARALRDERTSVHTELARARAALAIAGRGIEGRLPSGVVLGLEDQIAAAVEARGFLVEAPARRGRLSEQLEDRTRRLEGSLQALGIVTTVATNAPRGLAPSDASRELAAFVPPEGTRVALSQAFKALEAAEETERQQRGAAEQAEGRRDDERLTAVRLGAPAEIGALRALRAAVGEQPSLAVLRKRGVALLEREHELRAGAARLGFPAALSLEECRRVRVPADEVLTAARSRFDAANKDLRLAETRESDAAEKAASAANELRDHVSSLPETAANADLASARARRDEAWRALRLLAADPAAGPGGREPLLLEHEARERALDATVDAVLSHADAVARVTVLRRTVETRQQSALSAKEGVLTKALAVQSGRDAWIALWQPSGLEPPAVEQASFTRDHERFVKDLDKWLQDRVQHQVDEGGFEEARARLRDGLGGLGVDCAEAAPLAALNLLLDDRVSAGEKHNAAREASLAAAEKAHADAARHLLKVASATATTAQARAELSRVTSALELPAATREDESKLRLWVAEGKTLADQLRGLCDLRESLEAEDAAYARRREQLRGVLQGLHERGFALADGAGSPLEQIQLLGALLQEARETKAREDAHAVALGALSSRARAEEEWSSAWTRHLEAASLPAWDVDEEAVRALLNRIAAVQAAEADLAKQRTQIEIAAQLSLGELEARVAGRSSNDLDHERVRLAAAVVALQTERNACHAATLDATRALAALDAMGDHDTLLQEREAALTLLVDELAETITVKGASLLLTELQEELAHTDQRAALLDRASAYLRRLTAGAIGAVRADDDEASLSVVRAGDDEALPVEALSDGTRDQVLLALRLAVAQRQLADKRLPFVLDDVLVHFDDARALAALQAFAELAEHTQVILFTHHRHLLDLGRAASVRFHAVELAPPVSSITELDVADGAAIDSPRPLPKAPKKPRASAPDPLARELLSLAPDGAEGLFLEKLGELGGKSGNVALRRALAWEEAVYDGVKARLVAAKQVGLGKGKGGSVRLAGVGPEEGDT